MEARLFFSWLIVTITITYFASAAPSENSEERSDDFSSEEFGEEISFYTERFCSKDIKNCAQKIKNCQTYMNPRTEEERKEERDIFLKNHNECREKYENGSENDLGVPNPNRKDIMKCTLEKMGYIVNGEVNMALIKKEISKYAFDAPEEVRVAVLSAVDTCPLFLVNGDIDEEYITCVMKACASAM